MSLDKLLLNLKILGCVPEHGRIRRGPNGILAIEEKSLYLSIRRFLFSDGRRTTLDEIHQIVKVATEKANDLISSKYIDDDDNSMQPKHTDEKAAVREAIHLLNTELEYSIHGVENLKTTYHEDAPVISELDIMITKIKLIMKKLRPYV